MSKKLTIRHPEKVEKQILEYLEQSDDHRFLLRIQCMLLLIKNDDLNCSDVAKIYDTTPQTVARWVHRLNESKKGISSLKIKPKLGRKMKLTIENINFIKDVLKENPNKYDFKSHSWDGITLSKFLKKELKVELKVRQCQRILKRLGANNKSGRPWDKVPE